MFGWGEIIVYEVVKFSLIIYYRGGCGSREEDKKAPTPSEIETFVYNKECQLGLKNIYYEVFMGAIKRFGYKTDLNE